MRKRILLERIAFFLSRSMFHENEYKKSDTVQHYFTCGAIFFCYAILSIYGAKTVSLSGTTDNP